MTLKKYIFNIYVSSFNDKVLLVKKRKEKMLKKIFSLFVCAMVCLISTNLVFADGTVDNVFDSAFFALGCKLQGNEAIKDMTFNQILSYTKKDAMKEIMSKNIDNIRWIAGGDIVAVHLNDLFKRTLNISYENEYDYNNNDIIKIKLNGEGVGESLRDTFNETAKMWLKRFTVTTRVVT